MDFVKPLMLQGGFGTFIGGHWNREGNQYVIQIFISTKIATNLTNFMCFAEKGGEVALD